MVRSYHLSVTAPLRVIHHPTNYLLSGCSFHPDKTELQSALIYLPIASSRIIGTLGQDHLKGLLETMSWKLINNSNYI